MYQIKKVLNIVYDNIHPDDCKLGQHRIIHASDDNFHEAASIGW